MQGEPPRGLLRSIVLELGVFKLAKSIHNAIREEEVNTTTKL